MRDKCDKGKKERKKGKKGKRAKGKRTTKQQNKITQNNKSKQTKQPNNQKKKMWSMPLCRVLWFFSMNWRRLRDPLPETGRHWLVTHASNALPELRSGTRYPRPAEVAGERPGWVRGLPEARWSTPQSLRHPQPCVPCGRRLSIGGSME